MITVKQYNGTQTVSRSVNSHKNMLIIAEGATYHKINEVAQYDTTNVVEGLYGTSDLSRAFAKAKALGVQDIFVMNVRAKLDYIEIVDVLRHYDFTYIVPLGIKFSDTFYNPTVGREMYYGEFYIDSLGDKCMSTIIMTDYHAALYEDMDHFLQDMFDKIDLFKSTAFKALRNGKNLCLVANNLKDHDYANLILASALCVTELKSYPHINFGPAVFDIDPFDVGGYELAYFKNNFLIPTSVENLKNFRIQLDAAKIITIDRVIKFIEREFDLSEFRGKMFNDYIKLKVYDVLSEQLQGIVGTAIRGYRINSVDFVRTSPSAGTLVNSFTILPINSNEEYDMILEV